MRSFAFQWKMKSNLIIHFEKFFYSFYYVSYNVNKLGITKFNLTFCNLLDLDIKNAFEWKWWHYIGNKIPLVERVLYTNCHYFQTNVCLLFFLTCLNDLNKFTHANILDVSNLWNFCSVNLMIGKKTFNLIICPVHMVRLNSENPIFCHNTFIYVLNKLGTYYFIRFVI